MDKNRNVAWLVLFALVAAAAWYSLWQLFPDPVEVLFANWHFTFLGLLGATIANATGAGGGVVFIPSFTVLDLTLEQALGTSIAIQCFGMTAGSISWLLASRASRTGSRPKERLIGSLLLVCGIPTVVGVLSGQYLVPEPALSMVDLFRIFSVFFGGVLLWMTLFRPARSHTLYRLRRRDILLLAVTCFLGAMLTSWISVAIGEFVALYLIFRHYPTMVAICTGVCMSSVAVLTAAYMHVVIIPGVAWEIMLFAAPAAVIGGSVARLLAVRLGPGRLKVFFATWILVTGLVM